MLLTVQIQVIAEYDVDWVLLVDFVLLRHSAIQTVYSSSSSNQSPASTLSYREIELYIFTTMQTSQYNSDH